MKIDKDEAKTHLANKPLWHHVRGKVIEVGLYVISNSVKLNQPAPQDLSIWTLDGEKADLDSIFQKYQDEGRMIVLNIGSFTCPVWRERQHKVQKLCQLYSRNVVCITIYVREAHANNEWALDMNEQAGISYAKPTTVEERTIIAKRAIKELMAEDAIVYIDGVQENAVNKAYSAIPIRICVIDVNGDLVFRTEGHGPFGYEPEKLALFLEKNFGQAPGIQNIPKD